MKGLYAVLLKDIVDNKDHSLNEWIREVMITHFLHSVILLCFPRNLAKLM